MQGKSVVGRRSICSHGSVQVQRGMGHRFFKGFLILQMLVESLPAAAQWTCEGRWPGDHEAPAPLPPPPAMSMER